MPVDAAELRDCEGLAMALADYAVTEMRGRRVLAEERSTKAGPSDWVTVVDIGIERHVRSELLAAFPGHSIVGEELGGSADFAAGTPLWYVDPVDGTTNFVHGLPWSSFSLALADEEGLVLGVVADPHRGEVFSAVRGRGAQVNHELVSCAPWGRSRRRSSTERVGRYSVLAWVYRDGARTEPPGVRYPGDGVVGSILGQPRRWAGHRRSSRWL